MGQMNIKKHIYNSLVISIKMGSFFSKVIPFFCVIISFLQKKLVSLYYGKNNFYKHFNFKWQIVILA